jgi:hypothetical protein
MTPACRTPLSLALNRLYAGQEKMNEIGSIFPPAPAFESLETANIRVTNPSKSTKLAALPAFFAPS